ncbi:hypothetical protein JI666_05760 [Bacillus sp. NTK071]|uniref:competence type IV pilus minor pilin ComGG n=1 Tax=Bacillus sp. NTK071 TaxID=2802175 RepID=UPI001A8C23D0|nr:competence type IV pilus minor pilin ComGG [Bacillus sp. NTK071]MBN8208248.1 hypothetical protein [Bacillus sp. NTK071]
MEKVRNVLFSRLQMRLNELGYMTAMVMLISTLTIGFILHLCTITENEREFLNREEEQDRKESLLVLGMRDTISYITKSGSTATEQTYSYEEGTITSVIYLQSTDELKIKINGATQTGTRIAATFYYNVVKGKVTKWGEELG